MFPILIPGYSFIFDNKMRLPSSKEMEKARLETFGEDWWPHDEESGHGGTSVKVDHRCCRMLLLHNLNSYPDGASRFRIHAPGCRR